MVVLTEMTSCRSIAARALTALTLLLLALAFQAPAQAAVATTAAAGAPEMQASEYKVKAAFVYKFGDYVEWPTQVFSSPGSPLVIGVVDADSFANELARITVGRTIGGRPIAVRKLQRGAPLAGVHMIFIGRASREQLAQVLAASKGQPTLTISESSDGLRLGSMINFVVVSDKVRFDVALPPAEAGGLKISSRLLAVARNVVAQVP